MRMAKDGLDAQMPVRPLSYLGMSMASSISIDLLACSESLLGMTQRDLTKICPFCGLTEFKRSSLSERGSKMLALDACHQSDLRKEIGVAA